MYLFIFLTLYMFRAHRAHHQERQIVLIQPLVAVTVSVAVSCAGRKFYTFPLHFFMIHLNIIIPSMSMSSKRSVSWRLSTQNTLLSVQHAPPTSSSYNVSITIRQIVFHNLSVFLLSRIMYVCLDLFN